LNDIDIYCQRNRQIKLPATTENETHDNHNHSHLDSITGDESEAEHSYAFTHLLESNESHQVPTQRRIVRSTSLESFSSAGESISKSASSTNSKTSKNLYNDDDDLYRVMAESSADALTDLSPEAFRDLLVEGEQTVQLLADMIAQWKASISTGDGIGSSSSSMTASSTSEPSEMLQVSECPLPPFNYINLQITHISTYSRKQKESNLKSKMLSVRAWWREKTQSPLLWL
jgi:hypothetical protein